MVKLQHISEMNKNYQYGKEILLCINRVKLQGFKNFQDLYINASRKLDDVFVKNVIEGDTFIAIELDVVSFKKIYKI